MLFRSSLSLGLLAASAVAAPAELAPEAAQDLQGMAAAFDKIFGGIDQLNADLNAFSSAADLAKITADNDVIAASINAGANIVKASKTMAIPELLNIFGPVFVMENKVAEIVETLDKNKDKLKAANVPVVELLTKDRLAADTLVKSITGNLPLQFVTGVVAGPIAGLITGRLDTGIKAWGGTPPATGSGPAPAAAPGAPAASSGGLVGSLLSGIGSVLGGVAGAVPKAAGGGGAPKGMGLLKGAGLKGASPRGSAAPPAPAKTPAAASTPAAGMAGMAGMPGMSGM